MDRATRRTLGQAAAARRRTSPARRDAKGGGAMKVYLVWDGYEDVEAVFLSEGNAQAFANKIIEERTGGLFFHPDNISVNEMEVSDAP